jgi:hypothetical protein
MPSLHANRALLPGRFLVLISQSQGLVRLEGLGELKIHFIGNQICDLLTYSIVPPQQTLSLSQAFLPPPPNPKVVRTMRPECTLCFVLANMG